MEHDQHILKSLPAEFPRPCAGSLSGAQPKIGVKFVEGRYVEGLTAIDLQARYEACVDLVEQLTGYAQRKRPQMEDLPLKDFLKKLRAGVVKKGWDLSAEELDWVMLQVTMALGGGAADAPGRQLAVDLPMGEPAVKPHVRTLVDVALERIGLEPGSERG